MAAASRVFERPGCGALHMIPIAARSRQEPGSQAIAGDRDQLQRVMAAVRLALFKIAVDASQLICDMGKTQDGLLSDLRERVKRAASISTAIRFLLHIASIAD